MVAIFQKKHCMLRENIIYYVFKGTCDSSHKSKKGFLS